MKKYVYFIIYFLIIFLSWGVCNLMFEYNFDLTRNFMNTTESNFSEPGASIHGSGSASVTVIRNRWYGRIIEYDDRSVLFFFYILRIPLIIQGISFVVFQLIIFLLATYVLIILLINRYTKKNRPATEEKIPEQ